MVCYFVYISKSFFDTRDSAKKIYRTVQQIKYQYEKKKIYEKLKKCILGTSALKTWHFEKSAFLLKHVNLKKTFLEW